MTHTHLPVASAELLVVLGLAAVASAQPDAAPAPPAGTRVFVTLDDGDTVLAGSLVTLSPSSIRILMTEGEWELPFDGVARVERLGDGTLDGAVKGAAILGGVCIITCGQGVRNGTHHAQVVLTNAAFGALLGWWFDRQHVGRTTLYRRGALAP